MQVLQSRTTGPVIGVGGTPRTRVAHFFLLLYYQPQKRVSRRAELPTLRNRIGVDHALILQATNDFVDVFLQPDLWPDRFMKLLPFPRSPLKLRDHPWRRCRVRYSSSCAAFSWSPRRSAIGNPRSGVQTRRVLARKRRLLHLSRRPVIHVIARRFGRHLVGSCQHDLPVRQSVPKWRTLQVFVEWKGYRGAGEWTRTTDLLITNKLLRGGGGVFCLSMTLI